MSAEKTPYVRLSKEEIHQLAVDLVSGKAWLATENSGITMNLILPQILKKYGKPPEARKWAVVDYDDGRVVWQCNGVPQTTRCRVIHVDDVAQAQEEAKAFLGSAK
jgi:hypothetical protein